MIQRTLKNVNPIKIYNQNNKKCLECARPMIWYEGLMSNKCLDLSFGKYICEKCNLIGKTQESRAMKKGRLMSKKYKDDPNFKWTDIAHLSVATQLGILREVQIKIFN